MDAPAPIPRILVVDDDELVLKSIRRILYRIGDISYATGASEARVLLEREPFDLVISDLTMLGEHGASLLRHVEQTYPRTARLLITGHRLEKIDLSGLTILDKPFTNEQLMSFVDLLLAAQRDRTR